MDNNAVLHPNLAASSDISDPRRYVFHLRPNVKFWDGIPLTSTDVAFSLNRHRDPVVASLMSFYFVNVADITATGPLEVTITMKEPDAQLIEAMSMAAGAVTSKAFVEKPGKASVSPTGGTMGTGPYRIVNSIKGQSYTVERNADYWNGVVPRNVKTVTVHVITDAATLPRGPANRGVDAQLGPSTSTSTMRHAAARPISISTLHTRRGTTRA
jgi:peptide/nickel transport system substrate-binding protein